MNKNVRERKEMETLFADPRNVRQAWKSIGLAIAMHPATKPISRFDKDGNPTFDSKIETYSYSQLAKDMKTLEREKREPTELEMILQCQMVKARTDTSAAVFIRDTLGGKPVDETKVEAQVSNPYEGLSDEELEMIQKKREADKLAELKGSATDILVNADKQMLESKADV